VYSLNQLRLQRTGQESYGIPLGQYAFISYLLFAFLGLGTVAQGSQVHRRPFSLVPDFRWNRVKDDSKQFLQVKHMLTITQVLDIGYGF
jgi:hypothetical protein